VARRVPTRFTSAFVVGSFEIFALERISLYASVPIWVSSAGETS
jgi:hypothetical protein